MLAIMKKRSRYRTTSILLMPILLKRFHHRGAVPRWAHDRAKLWNGAEMRERNGKRGKNAGAFNLRR
jgi:hypothetical protein